MVQIVLYSYNHNTIVTNLQLFLRFKSQKQKINPRFSLKYEKYRTRKKGSGIEFQVKLQLFNDGFRIACNDKFFVGRDDVNSDLAVRRGDLRLHAALLRKNDDGRLPHGQHL